MKVRWKWTPLGVIGTVALAPGFAIAWVLWGPFSFESAAAKAKEETVLLNGRDPGECGRKRAGCASPPPVEERGHCDALSVFSLKASHPQCIVALP